MYTIANKHNKKTRKLPSSSRNKHKSKSKSKNKRKHKYTIGKTRKYTKSHNTIHMRGGRIGGAYPDNYGFTEDDLVTSSSRRLQQPMVAQTQTRYPAPLTQPDTRRPPPQDSKTSSISLRSTQKVTEKPVAAAPVFTFDEFKQKVNEIIEKLKTDDHPIHDTLFIDLTTDATKITDPEQQKKAILIVETMYMFYSNNFPQVGTRIQNAIRRKRFKVQFAPLNNEALFIKRLVTLGLSQDDTQAIADALKKEATKHTVQTKIDKNTDFNTPQVTSALTTIAAVTSHPPSAPPALPATSASSAPVDANTAASAPVDANAAAAFKATAAAEAKATATKWDEWNNLTINSTGNNYIVKVAKDESKPKYSDGYRILFRGDGMSFAWGKTPGNILERLAGKGSHLEQVIQIKDITEITRDRNDKCKSIHGFREDVNFCITIKQTPDPTECYFAFFDPQVRENFRELLPTDTDLAQTRAAAQAKAAANGYIGFDVKFGGHQPTT
jgi:hypothetical protein